MDDIKAHFLLRKHTFVHFHEVLSQSSHQLDHDLGIHEIATQEYFGLLQWNHYKLPIS